MEVCSDAERGEACSEERTSWKVFFFHAHKNSQEGKKARRLLASKVAAEYERKVSR